MYCIYLLTIVFVSTVYVCRRNAGIFTSTKIRFYKAVENYLTYFFYVNFLLITITYFVYIELYIHIYKPNKAIRVAKLIYFFF